MGNCSCSPSRVAATISASSSKGDVRIRSNEHLPVPRSEVQILSSSKVASFSFNELRIATRNFRRDSLLGEGGFGYVFKGWIHENAPTAARSGSGFVVAVKKLKPAGFQGHTEWLTEVNYLGLLRHPNIVKLIGYCSEGESRLLVYEFLPRGSLDNHLFKRGLRSLSWATRIKVAIGAASGLSFLHEAEEQVIYRDFKSSNILLDAEFNAKLSDFGLAKDGPTGDKTHVTTKVMGTRGYAAPEYVATGHLTTKSDVYSFGVVLLELLTGKIALSKIGVEQQGLVDWAKPFMSEQRKLFRIMDPKLEGRYPISAAYTAATIVTQCLNPNSKLRPPMTQVLATLKELEHPKKAAKSTIRARGKLENRAGALLLQLPAPERSFQYKMR